jgi:hypothetical protein
MMKNEYKVGTLLQSRKHKHCIGMVVGYERKMGSWWHKINFAETNYGLYRPLEWLSHEIEEHFEVIE